MPARAATPARFAAAAILVAASAASAQPSPSVARPPGAPPSLTEPVTTREPQPAPPPDPIVFDAGPRVGGAYRAGDGSAFPVTARAGAALGLRVSLTPSPRFGIGLAYEHSSIGEEHAMGDLGDVALSRSLDALWADVRLIIFRKGSLALVAALGPGLAWQHVDASVIYLGDPARVDVFRCTETGGPGLGLRAGFGGEVQLGSHFVFSLDAIVDNLRLSSDPLGSCAPGAGSVTLLGARAALAYRVDVSRYVR